jgi:hypothetical protein
MVHTVSEREALNDGIYGLGASVRPAYLTSASINRYAADVARAQKGDTRPVSAQMVWKWVDIEKIPEIIQRTCQKVTSDLQELREKIHSESQQPEIGRVQENYSFSSVINQANLQLKNIAEERSAFQSRTSVPLRTQSQAYHLRSKSTMADDHETMLIAACGSLLAADPVNLVNSDIIKYTKPKGVPRAKRLHTKNISAACVKPDCQTRGSGLERPSIIDVEKTNGCMDDCQWTIGTDVLAPPKEDVRMMSPLSITKRAVSSLSAIRPLTFLVDNLAITPPTIDRGFPGPERCFKPREGMRSLSPKKNYTREPADIGVDTSCGNGFTAGSESCDAGDTGVAAASVQHQKPSGNVYFLSPSGKNLVDNKIAERISTSENISNRILLCYHNTSTANTTTAGQSGDVGLLPELPPAIKKIIDPPSNYENFTKALVGSGN